jgi:hypothetical protein
MHPVVYNVLHVIKSQVIPVCLNGLFDFIIRGIVPISEFLSTNQRAKGYTDLCLMNNGGYGNRERWWVSHFDIIVDPL